MRKATGGTHPQVWCRSRVTEMLAIVHQKHRSATHVWGSLWSTQDRSWSSGLAKPSLPKEEVYAGNRITRNIELGNDTMLLHRLNKDNQIMIYAFFMLTCIILSYARSLFVHEPTLWNKLPADIIKSVSILNTLESRLNEYYRSMQNLQRVKTLPTVFTSCTNTCTFTTCITTYTLVLIAFLSIYGNNGEPCR